MRKSEIGDRPVLVLREPKPLPPEPHKCAVYYGEDANKEDNGAIIQCECGRRYRCRHVFDTNKYVWVRRILPWPPKQIWPDD